MRIYKDRSEVPGIPPLQNSSLLLGDKLQTFLEEKGITEGTYRNIKRLIGLSEHCNCSGRKDALNELQLGVQDALKHLQDGDLEELAKGIGTSLLIIKKKLFPSSPQEKTISPT